MRRLRDRLALVGLRWRLAGWVTVVVLICTGISFVAVYDGTGSQVRQQIDKEIFGDAGDLAHDLVLAKGDTPARIARAAESYVRDQSFAASSTVLFALVPGAPRPPTALSCSRTRSRTTVRRPLRRVRRTAARSAC
jgi:hypothetical protein